MPNEILVDWTTPAGSGFVSVFMFESALAIDDQRSDLNDFLESVSVVLTTSTQWVIREVGRTLNDVTGIIEDEWHDAVPFSGGGAGSGEAVPDSSQILVRWNTSEIVGNRFLKGRQYIPGAAIAGVDDGNLLAANVTAVGNAANALIAAASGIGVWHRPVAHAGGDFKVASTASCWNEFAVLRNRRK